MSTSEVALAAIKEIAQLSLNAAPFNLFLDELLEPSTKLFRWVSELGHVRETRTALSGLFGRFVARAYLTRYHGFLYFEPIRTDAQVLRGWPSLLVKRKRSITGDLPDWVIAISAAHRPTIAIAEAKGSHNVNGPFASLEAAKKQVARVDVLSGKTALRVKRYAIAARWAVHGKPKLLEPWLVVDDPEDGERAPSASEASNFARAIALGHFASLADGFGLAATAAALQQAKVNEPGHLRVPHEDVSQIETDSTTEDMIGAVVTSTGVVPIPRQTDPVNFLAAFRAVHGDRSLFLGVSADTLREVDRGVPSQKDAEALITGVPPEVDAQELFSRVNQTGDGATTIPIHRLRDIRRTTEQ